MAAEVKAAEEKKPTAYLNSVKMDRPPAYGTPVAEGSNFYTKTNKDGQVIMNKKKNEPQQFATVSFLVDKSISKDGYAHFETPAGAVRESKGKEGFYNVFVPTERETMRLNVCVSNEKDQKKVFENKEFPREDVIASHMKQQHFVNKRALAKAPAEAEVEAQAEAEMG